jgi:hypothetical protein
MLQFQILGGAPLPANIATRVQNVPFDNNLPKAEKITAIFASLDQAGGLER